MTITVTYHLIELVNTFYEFTDKSENRGGTDSTHLNRLINSLARPFNSSEL